MGPAQTFEVEDHCLRILQLQDLLSIVPPKMLYPEPGGDLGSIGVRLVTSRKECRVRSASARYLLCRQRTDSKGGRLEYSLTRDITLQDQIGIVDHVLSDAHGERSFW